MATVAYDYEDRNMSMGRVFERAFATIVHNPLVTLGLAFLFGALPSLLSSYTMGAFRAEMVRAELAKSGAALASMRYEILAVSLVSWAIAIIIAALTQAVLTRATVAESEGAKANFKESVTAAFRVLLPLAALMLLLAIAVIIGMVLLIVPGVMLYVMWSVASPSLVEERRGVFGSFGRSRELTKGARWRIFGILLVILVGYWILSGAVGLLTIRAVGLNATAIAQTGQLPFGYIAFSLVVSTIINVFWGTVQASLYVELRQWKEGGTASHLEQVFS